MRLSVIIPVLNEEEALKKLLPQLTSTYQSTEIEILVVDGGSNDRSTEVAGSFGAIVVQSKASRAIQLNSGARYASGEILYFLHADSIVPRNFDQIIRNAHQSGHLCGCFRLAFNYSHWIIDFSSWLTRFDIKNYQFGDQSLYVDTKLFNRIEGYNEQLLIMEDIDIVTRLRTHSKFTILPHKIITSARKYLKYGVIRTEFTHIVVYFMFLFGINQQQIVTTYNRLLKGKQQVPS